jgi:queuine tRNA-ribosyltransferase
MVGEPTAGRLLTIHNLSWLLALVARIRQAVVAGELDPLRRQLRAIWEPKSLR